MSETFVEIQIPYQKIFNGIQFPAILSPNPKTPLSLPFLTQSINTQKPFLESLLHKTGAILFRGFPVNTTSDFNDIVGAFGFEELPYVVGIAQRTNVVGRVFTANESPPEQNIPFHHEMAHQFPEFPSKLFFFCEVEPKNGGETPIVLSHIVYERMKERHPEFVGRLEDHGLIYSLVLGDDDDPSSPIGRGWKSAFSTNDKSIAEQRAAKLGSKLEWMENGVKSTSGLIPAIKNDKTRQRKIWFNSLAYAYSGCHTARNATLTFGDGNPLPADIVYDYVKILEEECVAIPWQKGDVLLVDNLAALHSRRPSCPPRQILASLCK